MQPTVLHVAEDVLIFPYNRLTALHHLHTSFEIVVPRSGRVCARLNEAECAAEPGELLVVFPGVVHSYDPAVASEGVVMVFSDHMLLEPEAPWAEMRPAAPVVSLERVDRDVAHCLERLNELSAAGDINRTLASAYLSLMFIRMTPALQLQRVASPATKDLLYRAMQYMSQNLAAPLSIRGTARALGVNNYYLSHVLNERLNMGFRAYLNALRIDRARRYLRVTSRTIEEIAAACGFANRRTFDRVFAERCGCTPRDFRKTAAALRREHLERQGAQEK